MSILVKGAGGVGDVYPLDKNEASSPLYQTVTLSTTPGEPTQPQSLLDEAKSASKQEGTTRSEVSNMILRGLAGIAGGALYGTAFIVGGGITLAIGVATLPIAVPLALMGAAVGAVDAAIHNPLKGSVWEGTKSGALLGGSAGAATVLGLGMIPLGLMVIFQCAIYETVGRLGAGLCAFSMEGKTEEKQLRTTEFLHSKDSSGETIRKKSTNERLLDKLCIVILPYFAFQKGPDFSDQPVFKDYRNPNLPSLLDEGHILNILEKGFPEDNDQKEIKK
jgi:hypothetical protein